MIITKKILFIGTLTLFALSSSTWSQTVNLTDKQIHIVNRDLKDALNDPDSARFGDRYMAIKTKFDGIDAYYVCGLVNARNAFGGYTGFQGFIGVLIPDEIFLPIEIDENISDEELCISLAIGLRDEFGG
ncbi:MAG: hypothetical protein OXH90_02915 [Paracoccaceae bacterium]|nr:hypothetical protein [Paracoccaceae bacterium]MDE2916537.1 hypothetical protein [Paracoccaceae bacterium]